MQKKEPAPPLTQSGGWVVQAKEPGSTETSVQMARE